MTSAALEGAPASLLIPARTVYGTGLPVPIAKALSHLMLIHEATVREWPMTRAEANAEMVEAVAHIGEVAERTDLFTDHLTAELVQWAAEMRLFATDFATSTAADRAAPLNDIDQTYVQDTIRLTWALMTIIDREITGLEQAAADPGRMP